MKKLKLKGEDIKPLLEWDGPSGCIATDKITVEGFKIGYMYREKPNPKYPDSGWRFFQGEESDELHGTFAEISGVARRGG